MTRSSSSSQDRCSARRLRHRAAGWRRSARRTIDPRVRRRRPVLPATTNGLHLHRRRDRPGLRVGVPLKDMEIVQYHPTTLAENGFLITEGARGEGAHLLNSDGDRFMERYAPNKMELASRDVVSRAEQTEILEGRGVGADGKGIYLDITVVPKKRILESLREIVEHRTDFAGVDITREPIVDPAGRALHHGRRQDRQRRGDGDRRSLRRRRGRLRLGPRRQPARRQLAARHADLRAPQRRARGRPRTGDPDATGLGRPAQRRPGDDRDDRRRVRIGVGGCRRSGRSWGRR